MSTDTTTPPPSATEAVATIRRHFHVGPRTRNFRKDAGRDGVIGDLVERIQVSCIYPGYDGPELTAACRLLLPAIWSWEKHVEGYRLPGHQITNLRALTPWQWLNLLGDMIGAGVTCVGQAENYFSSHATREAA
jgi:hypothetical protein